MKRNKFLDGHLVRFAAATMAIALSTLSIAFAQTLRDDSADHFWNNTASEQNEQVAVAKASAGPIGHVVNYVDALKSIPAERAREDRRKHARALDAKPGKIWLVLQGSSTNTGRDARKLSPTNFDLVDGNGNEYRLSYSASTFLPKALSLSSSSLASGGVKPWLLFFEVPETAQDLKLRTTNLHRMDEQFGTMPIADIEQAAYQNMGDVHHRITGVDALPELPAEWTIEKYKNRPRAQPAKEEHQWWVVSGFTENRGSDDRKLSSRDLSLIDDNGNTYRNKTVFRYQEDADKLKSGVLRANEKRDWKLFYEVPVDAPSLRMRVSNLRWVEEKKITLALPSPAQVFESAEQTGKNNEAFIAEQLLALKNTASANSVQPVKIDLSGATTVTGDVAHALLYAEVLPEIAADRTIEKWKKIGIYQKLLAPPEGVWIHVAGKSRNNSTEERALLGTFAILDSQNREFNPVVGEARYYVTAEKSIVVNPVAAGQEKEWEAWFLISRDAQDLSLKLNDLTSLAANSSEVTLPIDNALIQSRGELK